MLRVSEVQGESQGNSGFGKDRMSAFKNGNFGAEIARENYLRRTSDFNKAAIKAAESIVAIAHRPRLRQWPVSTPARNRRRRG